MYLLVVAFAFCFALMSSGLSESFVPYPWAQWWLEAIRSNWHGSSIFASFHHVLPGKRLHFSLWCPFFMPNLNTSSTFRTRLVVLLDCTCRCSNRPTSLALALQPISADRQQKWGPGANEVPRQWAKSPWGWSYLVNFVLNFSFSAYQIYMKKLVCIH